MTIRDLKTRAVIHLKKRQDINQLAEKLYTNEFGNTGKIIIREAFREGGSVVYCVSDVNQIQPLFLIKSI